MGALLLHDKASCFRARRTPVLIGAFGASITGTLYAVTSIPRAVLTDVGDVRCPDGVWRETGILGGSKQNKAHNTSRFYV